MRVVIDTREQKPFAFEGMDIETVTGSLPTGDYSLAGLEDRVALERKSLADLVGCLTGSDRERFERELNRGRALDYFAVVIEAGFSELTAKQHRQAIPKQHEPSRRRSIHHRLSSEVWGALHLGRVKAGG